MTGLKLLPLGVGDAFTARFYTTTLAVGAGDDWLLIDCAHPVRKMLREASGAAGLPRPVDLDRVVGVALTHVHADHASGVEDYLFYNYFALKRRGRVLAHPEVSARLVAGVLGGSLRGVRSDPADPATEADLDPATFVDLAPMSADAPTAFGPFTVDCRRTLHPIPTYALKVAAAGRVFGFSADTAFDPTLIDWLAPADRIVHEVTTLPTSAVHTPYDRLAELSEALRARMLLSHYPDDFDATPRAIEPLRQGRLYDV